MKLRSIVAVALASALLHPATHGAKPPEADGRPIFPFPIHKSTLDNGLNVISVPFDSPGIIAYYTVVRTGSRNEVEKGLSGFAHFFEHMMFRGTEMYPQEKYNSVLKSLGADSNAFTTDDWTCYHLTVPSSALATTVEIEADRFRNLKYDEPSFQKEARAVLGEYNKNASSPFLKLEEAMQNTAFTTHTYKHTTLGFLADIKDMPNQYAYSRVFFDRWYRPENCTIVVTGDVKHDELVSLVRAHYGTWARGKTSVSIPTEPPQNEPRSARLTWPVPTLPTLYLGYHIPAMDPSNPDIAALGALEQIVFGETSPLYREMVLKEQRVVTLMAGATPHRDPGLFSILVRVRKSEDLPAVRLRIAEALTSAAGVPIESSRLEAAKSHLKYRFAASLRSPDAVARTLGEAIAIAGRSEAINELYAAYDRLTPDDLKRVAARYFLPNNETVVTLETEKQK
jgi:zinc protease